MITIDYAEGQAPKLEEVKVYMIRYTSESDLSQLPEPERADLIASISCEDGLYFIMVESETIHAPSDIKVYPRQ